MQSLPKGVPLQLGERAFEAEDHPVVEMRGVVLTVLVSEQRGRQAAERDQPLPIGVVACEPRGFDGERSEAPRSGGSPILERETPATPSVRPPDPEVTARHARRRFTTKYKLEILRKADACTQPGQVGELLRKEGLYSSHLGAAVIGTMLKGV